MTKNQTNNRKHRVWSLLATALLLWGGGATARAQAFKTLAATGKLVKISNLAVGMADSASADNATEEQLKAQAQRVADILKAYTDNVPQAQRGGVTWHQAIDSTQPLGLWGSNYSRKHAYATFADGIKE